MADYKKMYSILFNKITDIIDDLQALQQQVEGMYIESSEQIIELNMLQNEKEESISTIPQK